ncbi:GNAT family N-acetyltransferase [Actinokineospora pegani]|uniref:GNAT family N-acetyltransferase n=1 Tax=Actinokineospora pegani TaxID=2654637 RepID=UPI0012EAC625|nr:GNAT family N-acetyltransferase [Actinokineospora pegani]
MPRIDRATEDDWPLLRAVRVAALTDVPRAFASTLERQHSMTEAQWRAWLGEVAFFLATEDGEPVGVAGGAPDPAGLELVSVWVAARHRGGPLAAELVGGVVEHARASGHAAVTAWVGGWNDRAARFYARLGFAPTGRTDLNPVYRAQCEVELSLPLSDDLGHGRPVGDQDGDRVR